jgi:hypothetical protein
MKLMITVFFFQIKMYGGKKETWKIKEKVDKRAGEKKGVDTDELDPKPRGRGAQLAWACRESRREEERRNKIVWASIERALEQERAELKEISREERLKISGIWKTIDDSEATLRAIKKNVAEEENKAMRLRAEVRDLEERKDALGGISRPERAVGRIRPMMRGEAEEQSGQQIDRAGQIRVRGTWQPRFF